MGRISYRILVVEDHADVAGMMQTMIRILGHEADVARSAAETIDILSRETFDLLLVDFRLPDGNGPELMRTVSVRAPVKAVLLTAYDRSALTSTMTEGFAACLQKPVEMEELRRTIDALCK